MSLKGLIPVKIDKRVDRCDETFDTLRCLYDLHDALENVKYAPDKKCKKALAKVLRELFDDPSLQVDAKKVGEGKHRSTDLEIRGECYTPHGFPALYIVGKDKLRPGTGGDPEIGGFSVYKHAVVGSKYAAVREMTCCPCLVVAMEDMGLQIYAAYLSEKAYCVQLCDIPVLSLRTWGEDSHEETSYAFNLQVVRKTAQELRNAYARVHTGSAIPNAPHLYPPHTSLARFTVPKLPFPLVLVDHVPASSSTAGHSWLTLPPPRLLFTGFISRAGGAPLPVHVKFFRDEEYGVKAHHLLATRELDGERTPLAPAFALYDILPGMKMVVMQTLEGDTLEHLLQSGATVSHKELKDIHTAVALLHRHGFVHGNIRPSNVIIQRSPADVDGTTVTRAYLIDFAMAGRAGKARYPWQLDKNIRWPAPTWLLVNRLIPKEDDLFMLKHLLSPLEDKPGEDAPEPTSNNDNADTDPGTRAGGGEEDEEREREQEDRMEEDLMEEDSDDSSDSDSGMDDIWSALGILVKGEKATDFGRSRGLGRPLFPHNVNSNVWWPQPADELRFQESVAMAEDRFVLNDTLKELLGEDADSGPQQMPDRRG
ncbi:hypothetical protein GSI_08624 [Ganoderma sinense ZZ0214-1]|uniref:Protein kinase domain-containing protein n=1 Tax=Ganoderma sinense ZZ0214-1 TaxID=1077348 RepID=A0A2G8S473_9APHY|nr:hypothetical protein GSI_08624 [Ganoderma sinense ZZ0214-1]